jgi:hypothetical protein
MLPLRPPNCRPGLIRSRLHIYARPDEKGEETDEFHHHPHPKPVISRSSRSQDKHGFISQQCWIPQAPAVGREVHQPSDGNAEANSGLSFER